VAVTASKVGIGAIVVLGAAIALGRGPALLSVLPIGFVMGPSKRIVIEREVVLRGDSMEPHAVIALDDGFVVAGERGHAAVVRVDAAGRLEWRYEDPTPDNATHQFRSKFTGIVPLADGTLLLCGEKDTPAPDETNGVGVQPHGLVVLLDPDGTLRSSTVLDPEEGAGSWPGGFGACVSSADGALLFGTAGNPSVAPDSPDFLAQRLVTVDADGKRLSDTLRPIRDRIRPPFFPRRPAPSRLPDSAGSTDFWLAMLQNGGPVVSALRFTRVGPDGATTATRDLACNNFETEVEALPPDDGAMAVCRVDGELVLFGLDSRLRDVGPPLQLGSASSPPGFTAQQGFGYRLDDGSVLLFGRLGTNAGDQAAVQIYARDGRSQGLRVYDTRYRSFKVDYVYPLSTRRFLTARGAGGRTPEQAGLVLSWVTIK
jgi:hypothetical protein